MHKLRVIRVGGSLLTWDALPSRLPQFLAAQVPAVNVLLAGGGRWVQLLRESAERFRLTEHDAHWLAVRAMSLTARVLSHATGIEMVAESKSIGRDQLSTVVLDVEAFLCNDEPRMAGIPLPHSWDVTSDSIAARVAQALDADELVLLKSCTCPRFHELERLADCGFVDRFFPTAARQVNSLRFVNLREDAGVVS